MIFPVEQDREWGEEGQRGQAQSKGKTIEGKKENKSDGERHRKKDQKERIRLHMMSSSVI